MQLAASSRISSSGGRQAAERSVPTRPVASRRPCKLVCFKEGDRIDDPTYRTTATGAAGTPGLPYGGEAPLTTPGLRAVSLGPVASVLYPVLVYGTAAAAAAATLLPGPTGTAVFGGASLTATQRLLLVTVGASLIPSIAAKTQIRRGADTGILAAPALKQMTTACLLHGVLGLVVLSQAVSLRNPVLAATFGALTALSVLTTSYTLMKVRESGQLFPSARGLIGGIIDLLTPSNAAAAAYSVLTFAALAAGSILFTSDPSVPCAMFYAAKTPVHVFAQKVAGASTIANALLLYTVKQAADHGRQGSPIYRSLNGALALSFAATAAAIASGLWTGLAINNGMTQAYLAFLTASAVVTGTGWATATA